MCIPFLGLYFQDRFGLAPGDFASLQALAALVMTVGYLLTPFAIARAGYVKGIVAFELLSIPFFVLLAFTTSLPLAICAFLLRAHAQVLGQLEGPEAVQVDLMMRGEIDPFTHRNHLLLVQALMRGTPPIATRQTLVSASQELREGEERLRSDRKDATGLMQVGSAKLRLGELDDAVDAFERGRMVAPRHFALVAGLGAAKTWLHEGALAKVRALPDVGTLEGLAAVLPDLGQLTTLELRVVHASARPIAASLPALARAGKTVRILPLDVRTSEGAGSRSVRVEELFDTSEHGWALRQQLAEMAAEIAG